jgi:hypothetical protein
VSRLPNNRCTAQLEGEFAVFLIGARINQPWAVHRWLPVALAMSRMIRELEAHPELGFLGCESYGGRTTLMLQYWRSFDHLMAYARAKDAAHLPAWRAFNQRTRRSGAVGVWHETYVVRPGGYENVYVNMPPFALARVAERFGRTVELGAGRRDVPRLPDTGAEGSQAFDPPATSNPDGLHTSATRYATQEASFLTDLRGR